MAPFGWHGPHPAIDPVQIRLAQAGARRNHRGVAVRSRDSRLEHGDFIPGEQFHAVGDRLEVVEQLDMANPAVGPDLRRGDIPRNVGQSRDATDHRTGDADHHRVDGAVLPGDAIELVEDVGEAVVRVRDVAGGGDESGPRGRWLEDAEKRFRSAHVATQDHPWIILVTS